MKISKQSAGKIEGRSAMVFLIAIYLVIYPMVPSEESINPLKIAVLGLTLLILFAWITQKNIRHEKFIVKPEYFYLYLFFLFLCISPILGIFNDFSAIDWARDIAPLLNLLLLPVLVDVIEKKSNRWILYLVFIPLLLGIFISFWRLLGLYGFQIPDILASLPFVTIHPSMCLGLGLIMFLYKVPYRRYWLALAVASMILTFLSPTRTVWITSGTMALLVSLLNTKSRFQAVVLILSLIAALSWLVFYGPGASSYREYREQQSERVELLVNYQDDLSTQSRLDELRQTTDLFLSEPITGVGFGYIYNFYRSYVAGLEGAGYMSSNYTHNDILFITSKGGIIGLTLFGLMLYKLARRLYRISKENPASIQAAWAGFGFLVIINSLIIGSSTPVFQSRSAMFIIIVLLATGLGYQDRLANSG